VQGTYQSTKARLDVEYPPVATNSCSLISLVGSSFKASGTKNGVLSSCMKLATKWLFK
jgi:hypothetical protein